MKYPMREKYIDEITGGLWVTFGTHSNGTVDISDGNRDIFTEMPEELAEKVIALRAKFMKDLYELIAWKGAAK